MTNTRDIVRILLPLTLMLNAVTTIAQGVETVSMLQLIATPEKFDDKMVMVVGFLRLEHEGNVLYLHEDDYKHRISKNGLWIVRNAMIGEKAEKLNMRYVILKGTFKPSAKGHMSLNSGTITDITKAEVWPPEEGVNRPK